MLYFGTELFLDSVEQNFSVSVEKGTHIPKSIKITVPISFTMLQKITC